MAVAISLFPSNHILRQSHFSVKEMTFRCTPSLVRWCIFSLSSSISIETVYAQRVAIIDVNTGLDYVSHDDVLPYMVTGQEPFKHELFSQFLLKSDSTNEGSDSLTLSLSL